MLDLAKFVNFNPEERLAFEKVLVRKEIKKGEFVLREGTVCNFGVFIEKGCIRTYYYYNDVESTGNFFFENDWYADFESYFKETPSTQNIVALEDCTLYYMSKSDYEKLLVKYPVFTAFLDEMKERTINGLSGMMQWKGLLNPEERYLKIIEFGPQIIERVPLKYIANFMGIKPESLSRIRTRLTLKSKS